MPASAAVTVCNGPSCVATSENVLINSGTGATVTGSTQNTNVNVTFSGTPAPLTGDANGQANVTGAGGVLTSLVFTLADLATFTTAEFNLFPQGGNPTIPESTSVTLGFFNAAGTELFETFQLGSDNELNVNGQNFFGVAATGGDRINSIKFNFNPDGSGIQDLRQLRLGGVMSSAVPEPTTWAMMLVGFGAVGYSMRKRKGAQKLTQLA
jgi:hypothetical protein